MELNDLQPKFDLQTGVSLQIVRGSAPGQLAQPKLNPRTTKVVLAKFPAKQALPISLSTFDKVQQAGLVDPLPSSGDKFKQTVDPAVQKQPITESTVQFKTKTNLVSKIGEGGISNEVDLSVVSKNESTTALPSTHFLLDSESSRTLDDEICFDGEPQLGRERAKPVILNGKSPIRRGHSGESPLETLPVRRDSREISDVSDDEGDEVFPRDEKKTMHMLSAEKISSREVVLVSPRDHRGQVERRPQPTKSVNQRAQSKSIKWAPDNQLVVETRAKTQYTYSESAIKWKRRRDIIVACLRRERQEDY